MQLVESSTIATLSFDSAGLIPAVVQDAVTRRVLMVGYMNKEAIAATMASGHVTFFSRSKGRLWMKGETSGNILHLKEIRYDCDQDALLVTAAPAGPVCHTGAETCFSEANDSSSVGFLSVLTDLIASRQREPQGHSESYTAALFRKGTAKIAQKVGEEAVEVVIEAMRGDRERLNEESADLLFHLLVLFAQTGTSLDAVVSILAARNGTSSELGASKVKGK